MRGLIGKLAFTKMIIDLHTIEDSRAEFDFTVEPNEIDLESEDAEIIKSAEVSGDIKKGIVQTDVAGEIKTGVRLECSRCLTSFEKKLEIPFTAVFVTTENYTEEAEKELDESELDVSIFGGDKIDLKELVREQIGLNLPTKIFCGEECKGLCQKCGANKNLIDCKCKESEIDPRWKALENFKK